MGRIRLWVKCLDCGHRQNIKRVEMAHRSRPRCEWCGGVVIESSAHRETATKARDSGKEYPARLPPWVAWSERRAAQKRG